MSWIPWIVGYAAFLWAVTRLCRLIRAGDKHPPQQGEKE